MKPWDRLQDIKTALTVTRINLAHEDAMFLLDTIERLNWLDEKEFNEVMGKKEPK